MSRLTLKREVRVSSPQLLQNETDCGWPPTQPRSVRKFFSGRKNSGFARAGKFRLIPLHMKPSAINVPDRAAHARALCEKGLWSEGLAFAKRWHAEIPADAAAWFFQGVALAGWGRCAEAETAYRRALALDADNFQTWNSLAALLFEALHRQADGAKCLAQAMSLDPGNKLGWSRLAGMNARLGRHEQSLECAERALALDPQLAAAQLQRGRAALALGKMEIVRAASEALGKLPAEQFLRER